MQRPYAITLEKTRRFARQRIHIARPFRAVKTRSGNIKISAIKAFRHNNRQSAKAASVPCPRPEVTAGRGEQCRSSPFSPLTATGFPTLPDSSPNPQAAAACHTICTTHHRPPGVGVAPCWGLARRRGRGE
ncbi:hypothetical protein E2C01_039166 [Portunus trituberculatus]|uniref:Uncharacterized protein n=1 Tax=Portunus trituberculatus TaxID=210409 RepID=A0A5B7FKM6_PORTR|nr:hypothetical protein [Portunus trituberculatus]